MKTVVIGLGIQGKKRLAVAGNDIVATVDSVVSDADYQSIEQVPIDSFEAALVCVPDNNKFSILQFLLSNGKHVLVEKPLLAETSDELVRLKDLASVRRLTCYTAYNHRFEPHIVHLKEILDQKTLGTIYCARMFYGNGTAKDVKRSLWRDQGMGVLSDLGSHLLDLILFLFGRPQTFPFLWSQNCFENRAPDHVHFGFVEKMVLDCEATLLSWRNTFRIDIYGEQGSAHLEGLCKWGFNTLTLRRRVFPSGRPEEETHALPGAEDPTWQKEYQHFKNLCIHGKNNFDQDLWINEALLKLSLQNRSSCS